MLTQAPWWVYVGFAVVFVFVAFLRQRPLIARRQSPRRRQRQDAVAALCQKRGLSPGSVNLMPTTGYVPAAGFQIATMNLGAFLASANVSLPFQIMDGPRDPEFENSFTCPDGSVSAADYWRQEDKTWHAFSLLAFTVGGLNLPYVAVTRRDFPGLPDIWGPQQVGLESIDFTEKFVIRAADRRAAVMLMDEGMMQWLLDCEQVSFEIVTDRVAALVSRRAEPTDQPGLGPQVHRPGQSDQPHTNPQRAEPAELELLFKFWDGFIARVPPILRTEFSSPT